MRRRTVLSLVAATSLSGCQRATDALPLDGLDDVESTATSEPTTTVGYGGTTTTVSDGDGTTTVEPTASEATVYGSVGYGQGGYGGVSLEDQ
jgi:endonuclease YncB( thermonuclease family)